MTATRPSLLALAAYIEERRAWLAAGGQDVSIGTMLNDCVQMTCLVQGTYADIPLTFGMLADIGLRLVRVRRDRETTERALALVLRRLYESAARRGEIADPSIKPLSLADLRSYFMAETTCAPPPAKPKPLPRRVRKTVGDEQGVEDYDVRLPRVLRNKRYVKPDPVLLERLLEALHNLPAVRPQPQAPSASISPSSREVFRSA